MIRDPWMEWEEEFAYDVLAPAGITQESSMRQILDGQYALVDLGLWDAKTRSAWGKLRRPEQRLWLDVFLYPISENEISAGLGQIGEPIKDLDFDPEENLE